MEYADYRKLRDFFRFLVDRKLRPRSVVILNNGHRIKGYLLKVDNNHVTLLKLSGEVCNIKYTAIKQVQMFGKKVKELYAKFNEK